jgi:hypothetical protein
MSNAKNLVRLNPFLAGENAGDSFGKKKLDNKQMSAMMFVSCQYQTCTSSAHSGGLVH